MIFSLASAFGRPTSTLWSSLPDLIIAWSKASLRFVVANTTTLSLAFNLSISFISITRTLSLLLLERFCATASISSINKITNLPLICAAFLACSIISKTLRSPLSPITSEGVIVNTSIPFSAAKAVTKLVLPVPGGP